MRVDRLALAIRMVSRRPLRSALAALGLALALGSALVAIAIAEKGKVQALEEIRRMGANVLTVSAEASRNRGTRVRTRELVTTLTLGDARDIERRVSEVALVAAEYRGVVPVKVIELNRQVVVSGIEPSYGVLREAPLRAGRFFDWSDDIEGQRVAVLGGRIARDLFVDRDPVGETIRLRGIPFTVIGVCGERGSGLDAFEEDEVIFIPLRTARRRLFQVEHVHRLFVRLRESASPADATGAIVALMRGRHRGAGAEPLDFRVQDQQRLITLREATVRSLGAFQAEASVALLAAGAIGMFALQLLSVRERRAEIGTRRALGATRAMITQQFLVEAATQCIPGAALGVLVAAGAARLAGTSLAPWLSAGGFIGCCGAGIAASLGPARRAAAVHPATALRAQ